MMISALLSMVHRMFGGADKADSHTVIEKSYEKYDVYINDLRSAKRDVRRIRMAISGPTGNFVEDMATGHYKEKNE